MSDKQSIKARPSIRCAGGRASAPSTEGAKALREVVPLTEADVRRIVREELAKGKT